MYLLLDLVASLLGLFLATPQHLVDPLEGLGRQDDAGGERSLAVGEDALASDLLKLGVVNVEEVIGSLLGLDDRVEGDLFALGLDALGGLLDDGELLVNLGESTSAKAVGLLNVCGKVKLVGLLQVED